jgi:hypothetical protein
MQLDITERRAFAGSTAFGEAGAYEVLAGRARFAVDPAAPGQRPITDIALAPTGADGLVHFATDVFILKPADMARGNRRLFFDWGNRGNKRAIQYFNDAVHSNDPSTLAHAGNGFLFRRGYSVVFGAWQGDLLPGDGRMLLDLPVAHENGAPVRGRVRSEIIGRAGVATMPLSGWASTRSHPAVSLDTSKATLTRRRYPGSEREHLHPSAWRFARTEGGTGLEATGSETALVPSRENIHLPGGFQPGWIYELIYEGEAPLVLGLGHAAVRDLVSFLRHDPASPLPGIQRAYGWGRSQTGRAIRDFIHHGFNADAQGRRVFDGLMPHVAGAGRLNTTRFANLTVAAGQQYEDHHNPADSFPFAYAPSTDHVTGRSGAILARPETDPLVIHTQTATEYWQRRGSLAHTDSQGRDLPIPPGVRLYLWSGSQHAADPRMGAPARGVCQNLMNVVATSALFRAMLDALDRWATDGTAPPDSRIPTVADGTLVTMDAWRRQFPAIPGVALPREPSDLPAIDWGPDSDRGILREPPRVDATRHYAILVPSVDSDGNEIAGVRAPMVAAPLATYAGWNLRARGHGHGAMHEFTGSTIPFADTQEERAMTGDPRPAVAERYPDRDAYVAAITAAASALCRAGLLLAEDVPRAEAAAANWHAPRHEVRLP